VQTPRYLHGPETDQVLAEEANGQTRWLLADHQGTIRQIVDGSGILLNQISYDSFGNITNQSNASVTFRFGYTGREFDSETGQYYYRSRYYDPKVGRFISEDGLGFGAGDTNLSRYVFNSPTNFTDPSGMLLTALLLPAPEITPLALILIPVAVAGLGYLWVLSTQQECVAYVAIPNFLPTFPGSKPNPYFNPSPSLDNSPNSTSGTPPFSPFITPSTSVIPGLVTPIPPFVTPPFDLPVDVPGSFGQPTPDIGFPDPLNRDKTPVIPPYNPSKTRRDEKEEQDEDPEILDRKETGRERRSRGRIMTGDDALGQLQDVEEAQRQSRRGKIKRRIDDITKSQDRADNYLDRTKNLEEAEENFPDD
jgi:RHS repeat-associated protein